MSQLPGSSQSENTQTLDKLRSSWAELLKLLALGPEPEVRECPVCKHIGMCAATRCGYCWTKLSPLIAAAHMAKRLQPRSPNLHPPNRLARKRAPSGQKQYDGFYD